MASTMMPRIQLGSTRRVGSHSRFSSEVKRVGRRLTVMSSDIQVFQRDMEPFIKWLEEAEEEDDDEE